MREAVRRDDVPPPVFLRAEGCQYLCSMITTVSNLSGRYFSCSIPDLTFMITGSYADVQVKVPEVIFQEKLYPFGSAISLDDLGGLLTAYARQQLVLSVTISVSEKDGSGTEVATKTFAFTVLYSECDVDTTAESFYNSHFLSILMGPKETAMGRLEYLHYYGSDSATATAYYDDGTTATIAVTVVGGNSSYRTCDVSPARFAAAGKTLTSYVVAAGSRRQTYIVRPEVLDCAPILIFTNSFGVQELIYCTGTHEVDPKFERSSARFGKMKRNYDIRETRTFKADTGVLTWAMADWLDDLFRSKEVYVLNIYGGVPTVGREVTLTDSKSTRSNDDAELPRFTFSYEYAQRNHNVLDSHRAGRIFGNTFDFTFN